MSKSSTTIELNGKRYDARTGVILSAKDSLDENQAPDPAETPLPPTESSPESSPPPEIPQPSQGQNLDGFVRRKHPEKPQISKSQPQRSHWLTPSSMRRLTLNDLLSIRAP